MTDETTAPNPWTAAGREHGRQLIDAGSDSLNMIDRLCMAEYRKHHPDTRHLTPEPQIENDGSQ